MEREELIKIAKLNISDIKRKILRGLLFSLCVTAVYTGSLIFTALFGLKWLHGGILVFITPLIFMALIKYLFLRIPVLNKAKTALKGFTAGEIDAKEYEKMLTPVVEFADNTMSMMRLRVSYFASPDDIKI